MKRLAIFARAPQLGHVKTRLARAVGDEAALQLHRRLLTLTLANLGAGGRGFEVEVWVAGSSPEVDDWRGRFDVYQQPEGDLGERMAAAIASGAGAVVGCDIPHLTADVVDSAFAALEDADVVLGPTEDGGYCLIAMNRLQPQLFKGIPWGSHTVLATTLKAAGQLAVATLEATLWDVDEPADLHRLAASAPPSGIRSVAREAYRQLTACAQAAVAGER